MQYQMQIQMDDTKILREGKFSLEKIRAALDELFIRKYGMKKEAEYFYVGSGKESDCAHFGKIAWILKDQKWFMENVLTWLYYEIDSDNPNEIDQEDWKAHYLQYQKGT